MILASHGIIGSSIGQKPIVSDSDAQAFIDRVYTAGGTLSTTEANAVNTLVIDMKDDGIWTKMKAIYPMVGASAAACAQNLKSSSFTGTFTATGWTFASAGAISNGTNAYMDTSCSFTNMSQDSLHISIYVQNNLSTSNSIFNAYDGTNTVGTYRDYALATNSLYDLVGDPTDGKNGFLAIYRNNATQHGRTWNTMQQTFSHNSTGVTNAAPYLSALNNQGTADTFVANTFSFASIGDGLTDTEAGYLYNAVNDFQVTLSRQV